MSKLDGFNRIAPFYDFLKHFVFRGAVDKSQLVFLRHIPQGGNLLILGGGSGKVLTGILAVNPDCQIWYIEASSKMIAMATRNPTVANRRSVRFIHGTEDAIPADVKFDAVMTNFFLDLFPDSVVRKLCTNVSAQLSKGGLWIATDFVDGSKWWQKTLLFVMYRFFGLASGITATRLPAWGFHLRRTGLVEAETKSFFGSFIQSCLFRKPV